MEKIVSVKKEDESNVLRIFISYADIDRAKMRSVEKIIKEHVSLKPIIIADNRQTLKTLDEKVAKGIKSCDYFIPILTKESIKTQWINQEIGFARALDKKIYPIIDREIIDDLKGFIHKGVDLPYYYEISLSKRSENIKFNNASKTLIQDILMKSGLWEKEMFARNLLRNVGNSIESRKEFNKSLKSTLDWRIGLKSTK